MSLLTLALILTSAALHATWNLWAKQLASESRDPTKMWVLTSFSALFYAPLAIGWLLTRHLTVSGTQLLWMAGSSVIHLGYFLLLLRGYRASDLSVVYPVARGTGPLLAVAGAIAWLGERATPLSIAGALLVATGIVVLTAHPRFRQAPHLQAGLAYGLMVGVTIGAYTLWDGHAVSGKHFDPLLYYWGGELCRVILFTPLALGDRAGLRALWRTDRARILGIAALSPLSYILVLIAMSRGPISHIAPVREISILIGAWLGARLLGEGDRTRRLVAALAFAAGVAALAFA